MSDIEKAIQIVDDISFCDWAHAREKCPYKETGCSDCDFSKAKIKAIEALREKAERENPHPLTLEQIRSRVGKPVWVTHKDGSGGRWGIINSYGEHGLCADYKSGSAMWFGELYGTIAYDHEPKGAEPHV